MQSRDHAKTKYSMTLIDNRRLFTVKLSDFLDPHSVIVAVEQTDYLSSNSLYTSPNRSAIEALSLL